MLSLSFVAVFAPSALFLNFPHSVIASPEPVITPAPFLTRDAPKVEKVVDRQSVDPNYDLRARTPEEDPGARDVERRDFLTSCGYGYVDCGDGTCCYYGGICYQSGTTGKCRYDTFGDYSIDINSILDSLSAILSAFPTDFDNYLTNFPTNSAGISAYIASLTSAESAAFKTTAPATKPTANADGNGNSRASSGAAFQSDGSSATAKKGLSGGAIGGIVAAAVLIIAAIAGVLIFVLFRHNRRREVTAASNMAFAPPLQPPQMTQPGYPPQSPGPQTPQTVYSQAAPPYPGSENGAFMQQQQNVDAGYYKPPMPGAQEAQGDFKQQGTSVPPPAGKQGQQQQWYPHPPPQNPHELVINPVPVPAQQQWQPVQPPHPMPAGSGHNNLVYEMDAGLAK